MIFPPFVDKNKTKAGRASARLRYILVKLSVEHTGRHSMRGLAEVVGLDHSTLSTYIRKGGFSETAAFRVFHSIPNCPVTIEELMNPMLIGKKEKG